MLELKAGAFYLAATNLVSTASWISATSFAGKEGLFHQNQALDDPDRGLIRSRLDALKDQLETLGARVTRLAVEDAEKVLSVPNVTWGIAQSRFEEINNTLRRELSLTTILVLESKEQGYFSPPTPHFGNDVAIKFSTEAVFEVDEAAKCFALSRSTATVFHLMRVMEVGIRAVARCLQIPDPLKPAERNWGHILRGIKTELDAHAGQSPAKMWSLATDGEFFESAYASLDAVRVAWRNPTMHVEKKYAADEAEHVFAAVRGFMTKLAARCDEHGDPKA